MSGTKPRNIGVILLLVGVIVVAVWWVLRAVFPAQMGGPNIGAGFVLLVGYALVGAGLVTAIAIAANNRGR